MREQDQIQPQEVVEQPEAETETELSDEQLDQAAGGSWSWGETNSGTM